MHFIPRIALNQIGNSLFKRKIIVIYGARQVGKTTILKQIQAKYPSDSIYLDCDEPDIREAFTDKTSTAMKAFFGAKRLVLLDEAQRVRNIGLSLKLLIDTYPETQFVATGSSSFDLSNQISEPLTGRQFEFLVYPFAWEELTAAHTGAEMSRLLETRLIFGMYPEVTQKGAAEAEKDLRSLSGSYLYKDVLQYQNIKNPEALEKLLRALALQIGHEVSYTELSRLIGVDKRTVENYVQILEKAFIIFRLGPFSRNLRTELKKMRKIYFYDTGIRNALINNFNPLNLRTDVGALWENFLVAERVKYNRNHDLNKNIYFWRTHGRQELDYLEEAGGELKAFEFKWRSSKADLPKDFAAAYPNTRFKLINNDNFTEFIMPA